MQDGQVIRIFHVFFTFFAFFSLINSTWMDYILYMYLIMVLDSHQLLVGLEHWTKLLDCYRLIPINGHIYMYTYLVRDGHNGTILYMLAYTTIGFICCSHVSLHSSHVSTKASHTVNISIVRTQAPPVLLICKITCQY